HPALLTRLYERNAATFAAFGNSLRVRNGRVTTPGGAAAASAWEDVVGSKLDQPEAFVRALFDADEGRLAYLYGTVAHLQGPPTGPRRLNETAANAGDIDAAWLAQMIGTAETRDRGDRLDQLAFAQRVFGSADAGSKADVLVAIRAFPRYRMLMLSLERMGLR